MREAYYSIDVSWDGDDVERRLVECGVLERWKAGEIGSVECVMGGWEVGSFRLGKIVRAFAAVFTMTLELCRLEAG